MEKKAGKPDESLGEALAKLKDKVAAQRRTWLNDVQAQLGDAQQVVFTSSFSFKVWSMQEEAMLDELPTGFKPFA